MPAPTAADGAARGIEEIAVPSAFAIFTVIMAYHFYGPIIAGILFLAITVLGFGLLASLAKYWNVAYTIGFVSVGITALLMIPSILGQLVHPAFSILTDITALITLIVIGSLLISKLGLGSSRW